MGTKDIATIKRQPWRWVQMVIDEAAVDAHRQQELMEAHRQQGSGRTSQNTPRRKVGSVGGGDVYQSTESGTVDASWLSTASTDQLQAMVGTAMPVGRGSKSESSFFTVDGQPKVGSMAAQQAASRTL